MCVENRRNKKFELSRIPFIFDIQYCYAYIVIEILYQVPLARKSYRLVLVEKPTIRLSSFQMGYQLLIDRLFYTSFAPYFLSNDGYSSSFDGLLNLMGGARFHGYCFDYSLFRDTRKYRRTAFPLVFLITRSKIEIKIPLMNCRKHLCIKFYVFLRIWHRIQ